MNVRVDKTGMRISKLAIAVLVLALCGCGSGDSSNHGSSLTLTAGNWDVKTASTANLGGHSIAGGTSLSQNGVNVSGIMHLFSPPCFSLLEDLNLNGAVNGQTLQLSVNAATGQTISLTATGSGTSLSGTYSASAAACAPADQGTFTATLVPSATGTWQGTLTSASGVVSQATATLTQSGPDAHGLFSVSGQVMFSSSCLSSGAISQSLVNGASYELTVGSGGLQTGGSVLIAGFMSDPSTASEISGLYTSLGNGCIDNGAVKLTKQ